MSKRGQTLAHTFADNKQKQRPLPPRPKWIWVAFATLFALVFIFSLLITTL